MPDSMYALESKQNLSSETLPNIFPLCQEGIESGERAEYLPEYTRAVEGEVTLDKRCHAARYQIFGEPTLRVHRTAPYCWTLGAHLLSSNARYGSIC